MLIRNNITHRFALARGYVDEAEAIASVVVEAWYRITAAGLTPMLPGERAASPADPPDLTRHPEWRGASVTVAGTVLLPSKPPFRRDVELRVGQRIRRLVVYGDRFWRRRADGTLAPTEPQQADGIPLTFERAYGGFYDLPPGLCPDTGLPDPGGCVRYPLNPSGVGFYADEAAAADQRLPNIEDPDELVRAWDTRPKPAGLSPCPDLQGLRMLPNEPSPDGGDGIDPLRFHHHAPGDLVFDELEPGTPIHLEGVGAETISFTIPAPPAIVGVEPALRTAGSWSVRAVHVDASAREVLVVTAYTFRYAESFAPSWIHVLAP